MHWQATRPIVVLYIDGEMARRVMKKRLADAVERLGLGDELPTAFHLLSHEDVPNWAPLNMPAGQVEIKNKLTASGT